MIDSLLDSTLECYYNETCIHLIYKTFPTINLNGDLWNISISHPEPLNTNEALMSRFLVNFTVRDFLQEILVDQWNPKTDFQSYYEECQPTECSYSLNIRKDLLVVVTTLVGLLGGLSAALNLMSPIAVRVLYDYIPIYFTYFQNKINIQHRMSINRVSVIDHQK